jgi:hypothetical protein
MHSQRLKFALSLSIIAGAAVAAGVTSAQYSQSIPEIFQDAVFPGPWDEYIQAPANKTHIQPKSVKYSDGDIDNASAVLEGTDGTDGTQSLTIGPGGTVIFDFGQNIGGR